MKIGIVGLGLIGGSMAKSIKSRTGHTVYGIDLDQETMLLARLCGAIDGPLDEDTLPVCDLVLLAVRPQAAVDWVRDHGAQIVAAVVDLCGVKRTVVEQITPLANTALSMWAATPWRAGSEAASPPPPRICM